MAVACTAILAALHLEDDDLVTLYEWVHYFYYYFRTLYCRCTDCHCAVFVNEQNLVEFNSLASFYILDVMYEELLALLCLELLTVNFYDCVHFLFYKRVFPRGVWLRASSFSSPNELNFSVIIALFWAFGVQNYIIFIE